MAPPQKSYDTTAPILREHHLVDQVNNAIGCCDICLHHFRAINHHGIVTLTTVDRKRLQCVPFSSCRGWTRVLGVTKDMSRKIKQRGIHPRSTDNLETDRQSADFSDRSRNRRTSDEVPQPLRRPRTRPLAAKRWYVSGRQRDHVIVIPKRLPDVRDELRSQVESSPIVFRFDIAPPFEPCS